MTNSDTRDEFDRDLRWIDAVRAELDRYVERTGERRVTLGELYEFSERRLSARYPDNNNVRAKLRQQLQNLAKDGELVFVDDQGTYRITRDGEVESRKQRLTRTLPSDPGLTEETTFTETRRQVRDRAFAELVREAYDRTCAVCGKSRESPDGNPEVEAAHIFPKEEGGRDHVRNGVALCKFHHWAFDSGWLSVGDDYEIVVRERPDREGYDDLWPLDGRKIVLPEDPQLRPHRRFLGAHRRLHGFDQAPK